MPNRYTEMKNMIQKKYSDLTYWKRYQDFLPDELRFKEGIFPNEEFWDWKGNYIHLDMMRNPKSKYKFILLHGGGGNGRLLSTYGSVLFQNGYEYIAPDFPGFGLTVAKKEYLTDYGVWVDLLTDLITREKENDDRPLILFGASIGGMLAYHGACKNKSVKGIIATCLADSRDIAARDALAKNKLWSRLGYFFMTYSPFITNHIDVRASWISKMNYITNSAKFSKVFINDHLTGKAKINLRFYK